ncbi:hypothetical protein RUM44_013424 [Polyplax serrata]|uniref:Cell cycle checkpoint protein RAD17 n=1 Tax=Polyplax serrata TaxID=468196 RepID=A0ABR1BI33_POLSC
MRKTWTAPTLKDFNVASRKRGKPDQENIDSILIPEPKAVNELTVHPKKIEEVRKWVSSCVHQKSAILLITGPPGSGKTVTLKLVADEKGFSVMEWITPVSKAVPSNFVEEYGGDKNIFDVSEGKKFEDFVIRSGRYPSLFEPKKPTLIMVKDIPNTFIWKPDLLHTFLKKYKISGRYPIVFVVTDDENLDLHSTLFSNDIKTRFGISVIKFNPVSDTLLKKNLKNFASKIKTCALPPDYLEKIVKNALGDLRSATTDVMVQLRMGDLTDSQKIKKRKLRSRVTNDEKKDESNMNSLPSRDHSYDFYKRMGRILYPKRTEDTGGDLVHSMFELAENWCRSHQSFLHENYLQTYSKLEDVTAASAYFSLCDIVGRHKELEKYSGILTIAGLMMTNTQPKKSGFLPFKRSVNLGLSNNWKCIFNEACVLRYGVQERVFALDVAPLKKWLPICESSVRTLSTVAREGIVASDVLLPSASKTERKSQEAMDVDMLGFDNDSDDKEEDDLEIEEVED